MKSNDVINVMERVVESKVDFVMQNMNMCHCKRCRADVMALALNHLPPKYAVTDGGDVFANTALSTTQMQAEIMVEITRAAEMVAKNPSDACTQKLSEINSAQ